MFRLAAAGRPLHHEFAGRAAAVDGEMSDVVGNMPLVWAFCGLAREHSRLDTTLDREMAARRRSLIYLEKLRLFHAAVTVALTIALLAWAIVLWQNGVGTAGDVVLVCTLGLSVLHATRDLAVALVDVTQHIARLAEALATLLVPHRLRDQPQARPLARPGASVALENVSFTYPDGRRVFTDFSLHIEPAQRVGLVGPSGCGKSNSFSAAAAFLRCAGRMCPGRWARYLASHAGELAGSHRRRSAGHFAVSPLDHGEYPIWASGGIRCRGDGGHCRGQLR